MATEHSNTRLEAFCDGVFAIAITLLVIDIKLPATATVNSNTDLWRAVGHEGPGIVTFVLSFIVILITWANHHTFLKLVDGSTAPFIYANGFLLLTIVFLPFPTSLMGEYVLTDHASPAVVLYNAVAAMQGLAWVFLAAAALKGQLTRNEQSRTQMTVNRRSGYFAFAGYGLLAILAIWFPLVTAGITASSWIFWLIFGMRIKAP